MNRLGRYDIIEEVGRGAMGIVYRGWDPKINRAVALKCLRPSVIELREGARKHFKQEMYALGRMIHPNIVTIFDAGEDPSTGYIYIVMEYVSGFSLAQLLKENSSLSMAQTLEIGAQVCRGLGFAHSKGVIHRDIKPGNILLSKDLKTLKITDFGIARLDTTGGSPDRNTALYVP
ncbi:MAG: serine/threonine-protein kinase [Nitrospiria bacterium]